MGDKAARFEEKAVVPAWSKNVLFIGILLFYSSLSVLFFLIFSYFSYVILSVLSIM